jgi:glycolate oxidase iron-sulfur subunit
MKCGFCRSVCPVHLGAETTSPRARVRLARAYIEGQIGLSDVLKSEIGHCLNCKACAAECPSGVAVDKIVLSVRREAVLREGLPAAKRLIFRGILSDPVRLAACARGVGLASRIAAIQNPGNPLRRAFPLLGLPRDKRLPRWGGKPFRGSVPDVASPLAEERLTAVYFVGCAGDLIYPEVARATWSVLRKLGCRVIVPRDLVCCGTPVFNSGDFEGARALALKNLKILSDIDADVIITACGSCGLTMRREWQEVLGLDVPKRISEKITDIAAFAAEHRAALSRLPKDLSVTYHDSCHLRRGMGVYEEPRAILKSLDRLSFTEMQSPDRCCGGGGAYSIYHPDLSREVGAVKASAVVAAGAEVVVTGCPACMMQLEECLDLAGSRVRVAHTSQLLDWSLDDRAE